MPPSGMACIGRVPWQVPDSALEGGPLPHFFIPPLAHARAGTPTHVDDLKRMEVGPCSFNRIPPVVYALVVAMPPNPPNGIG